MNTLHLYAQYDNHASAYVVGTPEALALLRIAIDRALASGRAEAASTFAGDGEGYLAIVCPVDDAAMAEAMLPYAEVRMPGSGPMPTPSAAEHRRLLDEARRETDPGGENA